MCLNSKKPEQDFLLGTKSKRIWTEGILQGSTARIGRLQQGRLSWPRAEHSLAGAVRHCQMRRGRRTEVPFTPLPTGCRGREASCSAWDVRPHPYGNAHGSTGKCPHIPEGLRKRPSIRERWGLPSCLSRLCTPKCQQAPTPAKMGFQAVVL